MFIAVLRIDLGIPGARSLKDRRQVVKSLKERLINKFGVACAEVGERESWVRAALGISLVCPDRETLVEMVDELKRYVRQDPGALVGNIQEDIFNYESDN